MSADNGHIIRVNDDGKYVMQMYFASNDEFPPINASNAIVGETLDQVLRIYAEWSDADPYLSEYGLTIDLSNEKKEVKKSMDIQKFVRRSFAVRGVQVTEQNIHEVAEWAGGEVHLDSSDRQFIKIDVKHPLNEDQTRAHIGKWVLNTKKGFKIYTDRAFKANFSDYEEVTDAVRKNVFAQSDESLQELRVTDVPVADSDAIAGKRG